MIEIIWKFRDAGAAPRAARSAARLNAGKEKGRPTGRRFSFVVTPWLVPLGEAALGPLA